MGLEKGDGWSLCCSKRNLPLLLDCRHPSHTTWQKEEMEGEKDQTQLCVQCNLSLSLQAWIKVSQKQLEECLAARQVARQNLSDIETADVCLHDILSESWKMEVQPEMVDTLDSGQYDTHLQSFTAQLKMEIRNRLAALCVIGPFLIYHSVLWQPAHVRAKGPFCVAQTEPLNPPAIYTCVDL